MGILRLLDVMLIIYLVWPWILAVACIVALVVMFIVQGSRQYDREAKG